MTDTDRIGAEVLAARQAGECWKLIVARYGMSRTTLWFYAKLAAVRTSQPDVKTPAA